MRAWFVVPVLTLCALAAILGLRFGAAQPLSEGEILDVVAARYLDLGGEVADVTDCSAVPGEVPEVQMVVTCRGPGNSGWQFDVGPGGVVLREMILTEPEA